MIRSLATLLVLFFGIATSFNLRATNVLTGKFAENETTACSQYDTCGGCVDDRRCGWCSSNEKCVRLFSNPRILSLDTFDTENIRTLSLSLSFFLCLSVLHTHTHKISCIFSCSRMCAPFTSLTYSFVASPY